VADERTATRETLHMWTQIVGKIRMAHMPLVNHWWQVMLSVSPRGLTTGAIPYRDAVFDMEFDFANHLLTIRHSDGGQEAVPFRDGLGFWGLCPGLSVQLPGEAGWVKRRAFRAWLIGAGWRLPRSGESGRGWSVVMGLLGLGAGWSQEEHRAYGIPLPPPATRLAMLAEAIQICRLLWTGDCANYRGRNCWATVVGEPAPTAAAANAWCDGQGLDADHCYAVRLTHTGGPDGNAVMRPHR